MWCTHHLSIINSLHTLGELKKWLDSGINCAFCSTDNRATFQYTAEQHRDVPVQGPVLAEENGLAVFCAHTIPCSHFREAEFIPFSSHLS